MKFQFLTATNMKMAVFWCDAPCGLTENDQRFRGTYCFHRQDDGHDDEGSKEYEKFL
jgi:hypothetical protein